MRRRYMMKMKTMETLKNDIPLCLVWVQGFEEEEIGVMKTRTVKELELLSDIPIEVFMRRFLDKFLSS